MVASTYKLGRQPTITFRTRPDEKAALIALAAGAGLSLTDLVRAGLVLAQAEIEAGTLTTQTRQ